MNLYVDNIVSENSGLDQCAFGQVLCTEDANSFLKLVSVWDTSCLTR